MAVATAVDILTIPARLAKHGNARFRKLDPTLATERRVVRRRLRAESLGCDLILSSLRLRKIGIRARLLLLKTPDYLTAILLVVFRSHRATPP
jgi:hypothetical protein